jgi:hypothetical protein
MDKIDVYIGELNTQIMFTKMSYQNFEESYSRNDVQRTFMNIHHFLIHVSNIDKILDVRHNRFRENIFGDNIPLTDLRQFRRLRNHLEHFDERLDKWIKEYNGYTFFDMNFIKGAKGFPRKAFLRALDGKIMKFYGEDYDLELLLKIILELEAELSKIKK